MNPIHVEPDGCTIEEIDEFDGRLYRWKGLSGGVLDCDLTKALTGLRLVNIYENPSANGWPQ